MAVKNIASAVVHTNKDSRVARRTVPPHISDNIKLTKNETGIAYIKTKYARVTFSKNMRRVTNIRHATSHTRKTDISDINMCFCFKNLVKANVCVGFSGVVSVSKSFNSILYRSASCFSTAISGVDSPRSHFETALSE